MEQSKSRRIEFQSNYYMQFGEAWQIVKWSLDDDTVPLPKKVKAIEIVAHMETLNSITKDELQKALRWLFDHYEF